MVEYLNLNGESTMAQLRKQNGHPEPYKVTFWELVTKAGAAAAT